MAKQQTYDYKNLTKPQQEALSLVESLGIYELRALARVFGDNSPTVSKRNDHIKVIMDTIISGDDIKPLPLRQGRPFKELSHIDGILEELSQITGKAYNPKVKETIIFPTNNFKKTITFKQPENNVLMQKLGKLQVRGVLREKSEQEFYFTNEDNGTTILVKKSIDARLKPYDYLTGVAVIMNSQNEYILDEISSINFQSYKNYKESRSEIKPSPAQISFENKQITLGGRYIIKLSKFIDDKKSIGALVSQLKDNKIATIAIIPNVMYEDRLTISSLRFNNVFMLKYDESEQAICEALTNMIGHVERLQQQGFSVALFVQDPVTLATSVDYVFKNNQKALMNHTESTVELIKKLVMLTQSSTSSTTLFTTLDDADMFDPMYVSCIYKVSKKIEL